MKSFVLIFILFFYSFLVRGEQIIVRDSELGDSMMVEGPFSGEFKTSGTSFYEELGNNIFVKVPTQSFFYAKSKLQFMGQSSSQFLVLVDGIPQNSKTGIGSTRDYQFLDLGDFSSAELTAGSNSTVAGAGAFSGSLNFKSQKNIKQLFTLSTGSYGFQHLSYQNGQKTKLGRFSYRFSRTTKLGPSLEEIKNNEQDIELDAREINRVSIKYVAPDNLSVEFKFFNDNYDFDQYKLDDPRPKSKEKQLELIGHKDVVFQNQYLINFSGRYQINNRVVKNVFNDQVNELNYQNNSLFLSAEFNALDEFKMGLTLDFDFDINFSEQKDSTQNLQTGQGSFYFFNKKKLYGRNIYYGARSLIYSEGIFPTAELKLNEDHGAGMLSLKLSSGARLPSAYERFSTYGNSNLMEERNVTFEIKEAFKTFPLEIFLNVQKQDNLIIFNEKLNRYENLASDYFYGIGGQIKLNTSDTQFIFGMLYSDSVKKRRAEHSPLKMTASFEKNWFGVGIKLNQSYYSTSSDFLGDEIDEQLNSNLELSYQFGSKIKGAFISSANDLLHYQKSEFINRIQLSAAL